MKWFEELKRLRVALDLSQEQIAPRFHVTTKTWSRWEKGDPKKPKTLVLDELRRMAKSARAR